MIEGSPSPGGPRSRRQSCHRRLRRRCRRGRGIGGGGRHLREGGRPDHAVDDWVDLGPDPIHRRHVGQIHADHVGAAYAAWKWRCDRAGGDVDTPPAEKALPDALALEVGVTTWTELMVALLTVGRAQALLFAEVAASDENARRAFDRVGRDLAGHASLAFLELRGGTFIDRTAALAALGRLIPAVRAFLAGLPVAERWEARTVALVADLGLASDQSAAARMASGRPS